MIYELNEPGTHDIGAFDPEIAIIVITAAGEYDIDITKAACCKQYAIICAVDAAVSIGKGVPLEKLSRAGEGLSFIQCTEFLLINRTSASSVYGSPAFTVEEAQASV